MNPLLKVSHLNLSKDSNHFLQDLSFEIFPGEIVGLVGESGCGKSLTGSAIMGLHPEDFQIRGEIFFKEKNLLKLTPKQLNQIRGQRLSIILQDPTLALNPLIPIGKQLIEGLQLHKKMPWKAAYQRGIEWLKKVDISDPESRMKQYPHEISGGMKQRILIAMALICEPNFVIADEPTTALDATLQIQILKLLENLQKEMGLTLLFITHDLGIVATFCQRVIVMYRGQMVESGEVKNVFRCPKHPYTRALLLSNQSLSDERRHPLFTLKGSPPSFKDTIKGCPFASRCPQAMNLCTKDSPPLVSKDGNHARCWLPYAEQMLKNL